MLRRGGPTTAALVALALACAAPSASADVTRAESVLPPGNSGFVSAAGLADGTGSPHLYDQQQLFIDFRRKEVGVGAMVQVLAISMPWRRAYSTPCSTWESTE